jgi:proline dehydrogenase
LGHLFSKDGIYAIMLNGDESRPEKILKRFASKWIAGDTLEQAIERAKKSNKIGVQGIINLLGEHAESILMTKRAVIEYLQILDAIAEDKVLASISVKSSQVGISIDRKLCEENFIRLLDAAQKLKIFVWIDMESSQYTEETLDLYKTLKSRYDNVGIALQAYLKRSEKDLESLLAIDGKVRLCKGAYRESNDVMVGHHEQIGENYVELMKLLFEKGNNFAIATHDSSLIEEAKVLSKQYKRNFEFQMLMGVRENLKSRLVQEGFIVANYIPYGRKWLAYTVRRLMERKRNIILIFRSLFAR